MNLTKDQTHTVIEALKEYKSIFCYENEEGRIDVEDEDLFNDIEKLQKRYERSLKRKMAQQ
tara:strand:+ start:53 stop:235 length:183 start_codon:yes stop_codon:yes gene_type:complete